VRANSPAGEGAARLRGEREELFLQVVEVVLKKKEGQYEQVKRVDKQALP
jgi:hypothetical protein